MEKFILCQMTVTKILFVSQRVKLNKLLRCPPFDDTSCILYTLDPVTLFLKSMDEFIIVRKSCRV